MADRKVTQLLCVTPVKQTSSSNPKQAHFQKERLLLKESQQSVTHMAVVEPSDTRTGRPPRALFALVRAASEGEVPKTLADSLAKFTVAEASENEDGQRADTTESSTSESAPADADAQVVLGLGPEGKAQAIGLGIELCAILTGFASTTVRIFHAADSPAGAATANTVAEQLAEATTGAPKMMVETEVELALGGGGKSVVAAAEALKRAAVEVRPMPGGVVVFIVTDPTLLLATADTMGLDAFEGKEFEPASGFLVEYSLDGSDKWERHRWVSHE